MFRKPFPVINSPILVAVIIVSLIFTAVIGLTHIGVQSEITHIEEDAAIASADRIHLIMKMETVSLERTAYEWAVRSDTRIFLSGKNSEFPFQHLNPQYFNSSDISWLLFYDLNGALQYGVDLDAHGQTQQIDPVSLTRLLLQNHFIGPDSDPKIASGLVNLSNSSLFISTHPVLSNDNSGPFLGYVVIGKIVDDAEISRLTASMPGVVTLSTIGPDTDDRLKNSNNSVAIFDKSTNIIRTFTILTDILGHPQFLVTMTTPYQSSYGTSLIVFIFLILLGGFVLLIAVMYYLVTRVYFKPVSQISRELDKAALSGFYDNTVPLNLPLDLKELGRSARRVLVHLNEKKTDVIRLEHSRKSAEIRWETLFNSAAEGIIIGDDEGILTCNPCFENLIGIKREELTGVALSDLPFTSIVGDGSLSLHQLWDLFQGEGVRFMWNVFLPSTDSESEKTVFLDVNLRFILVEGIRIRFLMFRNVTEEQRLHYEQDLAVRQIDKNLEQLAALNDEIRNPLTLIAAWTELDNPQHKDKIMTGVRQINRIIDQIDSGYVESEKVRKYLQKSIEGYTCTDRVNDSDGIITNPTDQNSDSL